MVRVGDSKAFEAVKNIYGPDVAVQSLADNNHIGKNFIMKFDGARTGTTKDGETLEGKGRLTEPLAKSLASSMAKAIRDVARESGTAEELSHAFWRIFYHKSQRHQ
ncbi:hypothetical protein RvY_17889 [Ramazzottius varieornatus]|uniref:Mutator-like transposase domain-containing protein n=1 Tax=Ramazzottius varieornatus TaxID=947166 RepID=A0A1D1W4F1_RAMVA|nr:hypothetical protein RvY_17889 [Ramazzottius varieornatus]